MICSEHYNHYFLNYAIKIPYIRIIFRPHTFFQKYSIKRRQMEKWVEIKALHSLKKFLYDEKLMPIVVKW